MPRYPVHSLGDPGIAPYRNLPRSKVSRHSPRFIAEGELVVRRLIESDFPLESVLVSRRAQERIAPLVPPEIPLYVATKHLLDDILGFPFHQGVIACGLKRPGPTMQEILDQEKKKSTVLLCEDVLDPHNLGGIIRAAAGFGADAVVVGPRCPDPFSRRVLRVSMGTVLRVPIVQPEEMGPVFETLANDPQTEVIATVLDESAESLDSCHERRYHTALVLGSEGYGLPDHWIQRCDRRVTIPMDLETDSLNVTVAAGIFLHHFTRIAVVKEE